MIIFGGLLYFEQARGPSHGRVRLSVREILEALQGEVSND